MPNNEVSSIVISIDELVPLSKIEVQIDETKEASKTAFSSKRLGAYSMLER